MSFKSETMKQGFTLIELLVVAGIIIFLSAIIFANWRLAGAEFSLQRSAHKLAQDIRRAGEMAMSAREFQGQVPQGGYGIYLKAVNDNFYLLYADINGNEKYDGSDGVAETIYFEKDVFLQSISKNNLSINFKPPSPKVTLDGSSEATITIALQPDPGKTKTIKVNAVGLIEVQ